MRINRKHPNQMTFSLITLKNTNKLFGQHKNKFSHHHCSRHQYGRPRGHWDPLAPSFCASVFSAPGPFCAPSRGTSWWRLGNTPSPPRPTVLLSAVLQTNKKTNSQLDKWACAGVETDRWWSRCSVVNRPVKSQKAHQRKHKKGQSNFVSRRSKKSFLKPS